MPEGTQGVVNKELRDKIRKQQKQIKQQQKQIDAITQVLKQNRHNLCNVRLLDEEN